MRQLPRRLSRIPRLLGLAAPVAIVAAVVVAAWSSNGNPTYRAAADILLPQADEAILAGQERLIEASSQLAETTAADVPGVSGDEVLTSLTVTRTGSAVTVAATGANPVVVRDIANAHVDAFLDLSGPGVPEGAEIIRSAEAPTRPVAPRPLRDGATAGVIGLGVGVIVGWLWDRRRDRIRVGADLRGSLPVLAEIPFDTAIDARGGVGVADRPQDDYAKAVHALCANLELVGDRHEPRRILVTSVDGGEGKSVVAANLAWAAASAGLRTVLVGGDGRQPRVGELFAPYLIDVPADQRRTHALDELVARSKVQGADRLTSAVAGDHVVMNLSPTRFSDLYVLPTLPGAKYEDPGAMLGSGVVGSILGHLDGLADVVVIDTPALCGADDAEVLAADVDDVILVAAAGSASRHRLERTAHRLNRRGRRVRGVVVNSVNCRAHRRSATDDDQPAGSADASDPVRTSRPATGLLTAPVREG